MLLLSIETSCDETSAAVVENGRRVRSNVIASQIELHRETGGVVPEVAAREHVVKILPVIDRALEEAGVSFEAIEAVAVTVRPGLISSLLIGTNAANTLALLGGKILIPVNHIEGHIYANWLDREEEFAFPIVVLTVSGGHNELVLMRSPVSFESLGSTRDDAAGEAFDKVARLLGLPYPGGPEISRLAEKGDPTAYDLPRAWMGDSYDFSFSGLKSAVLRLVEEEGERLNKPNLAASFQAAVVEVLSTKLVRAAQTHGAAEVHLAGGVSANRALRARVESDSTAQLPGTPLRFPTQIQYCTDNAAMIAAAGYARYIHDPASYVNWNPAHASTEIVF